ncbi:MAG: hypothetical protein U1E46_15705 [Hyphomicrobiales bacterium]
MHQLLLMAHLILIATGTGMAFSNYINIRVAAGEKGERFAVLAYVRRTIGQIGDVVLTLIWITGIVLVWTRMSLGIYEPSGWFYAKVAFVVLLTVCHFLARRTGGELARTGDRDRLYPRMELLTSGVWLCALAAIVLAVMAFDKSFG